MKQAVLRVNCAYPGAWAGEMQRVEGTGDAPSQWRMCTPGTSPVRST